MALTVDKFRKTLPLTQKQAVEKIRRQAAAAARRAREWSDEIDRYPIGFCPPRARGAIATD